MQRDMMRVAVCIGVGLMSMARVACGAADGASFEQSPDNIVQKLGDQLNDTLKLLDSSHLQFEETQGTLLLRDGTIELAFGDSRAGFPLLRIVHMKTGRNFVAADQGAWWSIDLSGPNGATCTVDSRSAAKCSYFLHRQTVLTYPETHPIRKWFWRYSLNLVWEGIKVPWSQGSVTVTAVCTLWNGLDGSARWNLSVENHSTDIAVETMHFPRIGLACDATRPEQDIFTTNFGWGQLHQDPLHSESLSQWNHTAYAYPSSVHPLQFHAFYRVEGEKPRGGLYLAAHDGAGYTKNFFHRPDPAKKKLDFSMAFYVPDGVVPGKNAAIPYDAVTEVFEGDWYDAAQIYRKWALRQVWASKGPLAAQKEAPKWFVEHTGGFNLWVQPPAAVPLLKPFAEAFTSRPLVFTWYNWTSSIAHKDVPHEHPGKKLEESIAGLHAMGYRLLPYFDVRLWDMETGDWPAYAPYAVKNRDGSVMNEGDPYWKTGFAVMCPSCAPFRKRIAEVVQSIQCYGADGAYLDQITAGAPRLCYDKEHHHPLGGGTHWVDGIREMLQEIRYRTDSNGTHFVLTSEASAEPWMDMIDGNFIHSPILSNNVPIFSAVYGGYTVRYGSGFPVGRDGKKAFAMAFGQHFIFGGATSMLSNSKVARFLDRENADMLAFVNRVGNLRAKGLSYLAYGTMERPLVYRNTVPEEVYFRKIPEKEIDPDVPQPHIRERMPAVLHSVWRSPNGNIGVVFLNISRVPQEVCFDVRDLPAGTNSAYKVRWITTAAEKRVEVKQYRMTLTIPPLDGGIAEFAAAKRQ